MSATLVRSAGSAFVVLALGACSRSHERATGDPTPSASASASASAASAASAMVSSAAPAASAAAPALPASSLAPAPSAASAASVASATTTRASPGKRIPCGDTTCGPRQWCLRYSMAGGADIPGKVVTMRSQCSDTIPHSGGLICNGPPVNRQVSCAALIPRAAPHGH